MGPIEIIKNVLSYNFSEFINLAPYPRVGTGQKYYLIEFINLSSINL